MSRGLAQALRRMLASSSLAIGDITFGMEDGAVSVAGLVFGVAASTNNSAFVVLAGATGAVAGAVSMMAGRYLDVQSVGHRNESVIEEARASILADPEPHITQAVDRLDDYGVPAEEAEAFGDMLRRHPDALLDHVAAYELGVFVRSEASPATHATWMLIADLLAASVPVIPFALFPIEVARVVSLLVTGGLMALLGIVRGRIGGVNIWWTALQTMGIAGAAALAGVVIGRLVSPHGGF